MLATSFLAVCFPNMKHSYEKHLFFTEILVAAGVDPVTAERDACRIEHVISKETFERLKAARKLSEKAMISSDES